jgi:hypothetical protein
MRLLFWFGLAGLLAYILVDWIKKGGRQTPFIAIHVSSYDDPLISPNSYAMEDLKWFEQQWPFGRGGMSTIGTEASVHFVGDAEKGLYNKKDFLSYLGVQLAGQKPGGPKKDLIFVYISAHGVVDTEGKPCLLLSDSCARSSDTWLPLDDVVKVLGEGKKKDDKLVLFLDCVRTFQDPRNGLLYNSFVDGLAPLLLGHSKLNLVIISASGPGENAWAAPERDGTIFGERLAVVLSGADGDTDANSKISLGELVDFLHVEVQDWVKTKRTSRQTPFAIATTPISDAWRDWTVAEAVERSDGQINAEKVVDGIPASVAKRRDALADLWRDLDEQLTYEALATPLRLADLQFHLSRLEQLILAGTAYDDQFNGMLVLARKQLDELRESGPPRAALGRSLPLARQAFSDEQRREEKTFYDRWKADPNVASWKKVAEEEGIQPASVSAQTAGGMLWLERDLALSGVHSTQIDNLLGVLDLLASDEPTHLPDFVAIHFLRMLSEHLEPATSSSSIHRAITARQLAERAAAPDDYRSHYWIQHVVNRGDESRRLAEDHLFVGAESSLIEADLLWNELDGEDGYYRRAIRQAEAISTAYLVRDVSFAMLPHLSDWLLRKARLEADRTDSAELTKLNSLIANTHLLAKQLDQRIDPPRDAANSHDDDIVAISDRAGKIWASLDELTKDVRDSWSDYRQLEGQRAVKPWMTLLANSLIDLTVVDRQSGPLGVRPRGDGLRPLSAIDGRQRGRLRDRLLKIVFDHDDTGPPAKSDAETPNRPRDEGKAVSDDFFELLSSLDRHPALNLLNRHALNSPDLTDVEIPEPAKDDLATQQKHLWLQGGAVRTLLLNVNDECKSLAKDSMQPQEARRGGRGAREQLAKAETLLRMNASVMGISASTEKSIVKPLRQLDQKFLVLWHGHRALNDFWAAATNQPNPYFATATESLLRASHPFSRYGDTDLRDTLIDYRKPADSNQGVVSPVVYSEAEKQGDDRFRLQFGLKKSEGTPDGIAALFLRHSDSTPIDVLVQSGPVPRLLVDLAAGSPPPHEVEFFASDASNASSIQAVALFRGHVRSKAILVPSTEQGDVVVTFEKQEPSKSRIRVMARSAKPIHLIFVFDCSGSMNTLDANVEGRNVRRIVAARRAVDGVMKSLLEMPEQNYIISFYVYGHRAGAYTRGEQIRYSKYYRDKMALDDAPDIHPSLDVEPLVKREQLTKEQWTRLFDKLKSLEPHGWTPLYYSINQVLDDLREDDIGRAKQIIVLTDGDNNLFTGVTHGLYGKLPGATIKLVYKAMEDYGKKRSSILEDNYAVLENRYDMQTSIFGLGEEITSNIDLGGHARFYQAKNDTKKLIKQLKDALGLVQYSVVGTRSSQPRFVGDDWQAEHIFSAPTKHTIQLNTNPPAHPHDVFLESGEEIELTYNPAKQQLEHSRYSPSGTTVGKCKDVNFHVAALYPDTRRLPKVTFRITIQNADETEFSPRPIGFWAQVTPTGFAGRKPNPVPVYHFTDMHFVDGTPVPVLQFTVLKWPDNAKRAEIDLWFCMQEDVKPWWRGKAEATKRFNVPANTEGEFTMKTEPARSGRGFTLTVTELYGADATDLQRSRVMAYPPPSKTVRTLLKKRGGVRHKFHYLGGITRSDTTLEITARDSMQSEYIGLVEPIQITLPD